MLIRLPLPTPLLARLLKRVAGSLVSLFFLFLWWPVLFFGQVAGLGQTARVQRGPSEAARCASDGTALLPSILNDSRRAMNQGSDSKSESATSLRLP